MPMNFTTRPYVKRSKQYLVQAEVEQWRGDYLQASKKLWCAIVQIIKAVAEDRGWRHSEHAYIYATVFAIVQETRDEGLWMPYLTARNLHENPDKSQLGERDITYHLDDVANFVYRLRGLIDGNCQN